MVKGETMKQAIGALAICIGTACASMPAAQSVRTPIVYVEPAFDGWNMELDDRGMVRLAERNGNRSTYWLGPVGTIAEARMLVDAVLTDEDQDYTDHILGSGENPCDDDSGWDDRISVTRYEVECCIRSHGLNPEEFWADWTSKEDPGSLDVTAWIYR